MKRSPPVVSITNPSIELWTRPEEITAFAATVAHAGGKCYRRKIKDPAQFVRDRIDNRHESVLRHVMLVVDVKCSRVTSHQLVRHGLANFTQESQRGVKFGSHKRPFEFICPPSIAAVPALRDNFLLDCEYAAAAYLRYTAAGIPAEDARYILGGAAVTHLTMSANMQEWRHVWRERTALDAQWELRACMWSLVRTVYRLAPEFLHNLPGIEEITHEKSTNDAV